MFLLALGVLLSAAHLRAAAPCPGPDPGCGNFTLPSWSDGAGWTDPGRWQTILYADLDGDGQVELLGRSADGFEVWQFHAADGTCQGVGTGCGRWEHVTTYTEITDDPLVTASIRAAPLYGTAAEQVFLWDCGGVRVYSFNTKRNQLVLTDVVTALGPQNCDAGHEAKYIETLQAVSWLPETGGVVKESVNLAMRDSNSN